MDRFLLKKDKNYNKNQNSTWKMFLLRAYLGHGFKAVYSTMQIPKLTVKQLFGYWKLDNCVSMLLCLG